NSTGNDQIIAAEGITDVAGLAGKRVAVEAGTVDHFLLLLALEEAGLTGDDVEIVPLATADAAAAFKDGAVDAVGAFAPFTTTALERPGSSVISDSSEFPGAIPDHLVVSAELAESNPEGVQAMVNTWFDVLAFIEANPDEAVEIMATQADVTVEDYESYDAGTTIFSLEDNVAAFTPGDTDANLDFQAEKIAEFIVSTGLADQAPSLDGLFDPSFIENVEE
nr:ABC transporter substrate-binding protein [Micromonospora sp. DSM 115978]